MNDVGAFELITTIKETIYSKAVLKAIRAECERKISVLNDAAAKELEANLRIKLAVIKNDLFSDAFDNLPTGTAFIVETIDKFFHNLPSDKKWVHVKQHIGFDEVWKCSNGDKCDLENDEQKIIVRTFRFAPHGLLFTCCDRCMVSNIEKTILQQHPVILASLREEFAAYCSSRLAKRQRRK